jgi:hypothetical protein
MGCHSYLIWSDWILCEDILHVSDFIYTTQQESFLLLICYSISIANICLKVSPLQNITSTDLVKFLVLHFFKRNFWYYTNAWWIYLFPNRFQANMVAYQNLITKSMYDKQLDSGRGTLLHLCDDVIQQEVCKPHSIPERFHWLCVWHWCIIKRFCRWRRSSFLTIFWWSKERPLYR